LAGLVVATTDVGGGFAIGLFGDWGAGKSSLVNHLKQDVLDLRRAEPVKDRGRTYIAEFNAWRYEHTDNITAGLAQEVVAGLMAGDVTAGTEAKSCWCRTVHRETLRWRFAWREHHWELMGVGARL